MRISTGMIFDGSVAAINKQTETLFHLQQQVSTGRRMLTPADDPAASAQALTLQQAQDITDQYTSAQGSASDTLGLIDSQLSGVSDLLMQAKTLAVQGGSTATLSNSDRISIATQLRSSFDQLLGIANATDGSGQYLFSGYMGNTKPFGGNVENGVTYFGDDGQRSLQVSASQQLAVSESGNSVFNRINIGNGNFVTSYNPANTGTGVIDNGGVTDPIKWQSVSNSGNLQVKFWVDAAGTIGPANATYYDLVDANGIPPQSLFSAANSSAGGVGNTFTHAYTSGQPINFSGLAAPYSDFGATVSVTGTPSSGDTFTVQKSSSQSMFKTLGDLITALEIPLTSSTNGSTVLANQIRTALNNIDQANDNVLSARSRIGSRMNESDSLKSVNSSLNLQYQQSLSQLQDVDFAKAISDMTRAQTQLQAAQKTFSNASQLSLFNYIS